MERMFVEHILVIGLRVLSGGRTGITKDQCHITDKAADDFSPEFDIHMPKTDDEWDKINHGLK